MKVIVIGTGFGRNAVAPAFESAGCQVDVVSPRDAQAVRAAVTGPCDLVSIHSPPFMHLEHVKLAVDNGRDVLCDKPFGRNALEAREMLAMAESALHFLNFEFRFDPLRAKLKELIDAGAIGDPQHLSSTMHISYGRSRPHGWLMEKDKGGGWIGAYASHIVDMLRWLFGEIETVSSQPRIDVKQRRDRDDAGKMHNATAEDAVTACFRTKGGVTASLDTAFSAAVDVPGQTLVFGSDGVLQLTHSELLLKRPDRDPEQVAAATDKQPVGAAMAQWAHKVCEAFKAREQIAPNFHDGLACAEVLDAMRAS